MNEKCPTITASAGMSGNNQPWIVRRIYDKGDLPTEGGNNNG